MSISGQGLSRGSCIHALLWCSSAACMITMTTRNLHGISPPPEAHTEKLGEILLYGTCMLGVRHTSTLHPPFMNHLLGLCACFSGAQVSYWWRLATHGTMC
ncbi:unnamed protein product [Discosporangium mesarthrocarpum]